MITRYNPAIHKELAIKMGRAIHAESRFRNYNFSEARILKLLDNPNVFCAFSFKEDQAVGFLMGIIQPIWFSEDKAGFDLSLYIVPECRGGTYAVRLIKEFELFCKQNGCVEVNLNSSAEISTETALRLYKKLGYKECGFITRKEI